MPTIHWGEVWGMVIPHLIRVAVVIVLAFLLWRVVARVSPPFLRLLLKRNLKSRSEEDVQQRVETLQIALRRTIGVLLFVAVAFVVLAEAGVNIAPFLAGLGIAGVAVGFAAQHLVRDVLNGLIMLVEDWYSKGDVVQVAGISGLVEDITLRRTVLRDLDGVVHSVPNGEITVASNFTKEWSRVNLNVTVAYGEDLDRVIAVVNQVGRELAQDQYWGTLVLEAPSVLRVDNLGASGVEIKVLGNTRPIKQWDVMGELRRRLKRRFDEEGIEMALPHTKVYFGNPLEHRSADGAREASKGDEAPTFTMEAPNALTEKGRLLPVLRTRTWGLVTDLDGTISPIATTPEEAAVPQTMKDALAALAGFAVVAVLSGRGVAQTRAMVGLEGLLYFGNHGLETWEEGEVKLVGGAEQYLVPMAQALEEIEGVTQVPGVRIERKGITATIHYRLAVDPDAARNAVLGAIARSPNAASLKVTEGRRVVELRPPLAINKGTTIRSLVETHRLQGLLYLGDDMTDVDAFYAVASLRQARVKGLSIGVFSMENRPEFRMAIDLSLNSVQEVEELLRWIGQEAGSLVRQR